LAPAAKTGPAFGEDTITQRLALSLPGQRKRKSHPSSRDDIVSCELLSRIARKTERAWKRTHHHQGPIGASNAPVHAMKDRVKGSARFKQIVAY
jgi:hypothetical protein